MITARLSDMNRLIAAKHSRRALPREQPEEHHTHDRDRADGC